MRILRENIKVGDQGFCAVRYRELSGSEQVWVYAEQDGKEIPLIKTRMSRLDKDIDKLLDYGMNLWQKDLVAVESQIRNQFDTLPLYREARYIGWNYDENGMPASYKSSEWDGVDGPIPMLETPDKKGETGIDVLNAYMKGHPERQAVLLHQCAAPIAGLYGHCSVMVLAGRTSNGKTTIGKLCQSFYGNPLTMTTCTELNGTKNTVELLLAGVKGSSVYLDDASLTGKGFPWTEVFYRLSSGTTKQRMDVRHGNRVTGGEQFCAHILITAETSLLGTVAPEEQGALGRVLELAVEDNSGCLFDDASQQKQMARFWKENYGNLMPLFMGQLFQMGVETVKGRTEELEEQLFSTYTGECNTVTRHFKTFAAMACTAEIMKGLGLEFDIDGVIKCLVSCVKDSLEEMQSRSEGHIYAEIGAMLVQAAKQEGTCKGDGLYVLPNKVYKEVVKEAGQSLGTAFETGRKLNGWLEKQGILKKARGTYSAPHTCGGESVRGYLIQVDEKGGAGR